MRTRSLALGLLSLALLAGPALAKAPDSNPASKRPLPAGPRWNSEQPLSWDNLKGKVVLLDFWNRT